jgi:hypothetical protein
MKIYEACDFFMNESETLIKEKITNEMSKMLSNFQLEKQDVFQT